MGQVSITINGRNYQVACDDGQESHLIKLANFLNDRVEELSGTMGQIGDNRILLMASLLIVDELFDAKKKTDQHVSAGRNANSDSFEMTKATQALSNLSKRLDALATKIEAA